MNCAIEPLVQDNNRCGEAPTWDAAGRRLIWTDNQSDTVYQLAADTGEEYSVNIPHQGAVPGFAPEAVIELFAKVSSRGLKPVTVPAFPPMIMVHQQLLMGYLELVVQGILEKDRQKIYQALLIHPFTQSATRARELFDTMWEEERDVHGPYWE